MIFIGELLLVEEMKRYHFIIPKGFSLYKNSSIIYQTHVVEWIFSERIYCNLVQGKIKHQDSF